MKIDENRRVMVSREMWRGVAGWATVCRVWSCGEVGRMSTPLCTTAAAPSMQGKL